VVSSLKLQVMESLISGTGFFFTIARHGDRHVFVLTSIACILAFAWSTTIFAAHIFDIAIVVCINLFSMEQLV
jgi:hypothetical protein